LIITKDTRTTSVSKSPIIRFQKYKQLLQITKEDTVTDQSSLEVETLILYLKPNLKAKSFFTGLVKSGIVSYTPFIKKTYGFC
jgi:hypothetical protein